MTESHPLLSAPTVEEIYKEHRDRIYGYFIRRLGNHYDAEELTQRVFVDAINALSGSKTPPDSVLGWLYTVAERRLADELRRRQQATRLIQRLRLSGRPRSEYTDVTGTALAEAIAGLSPSHGRVVACRLIHGLSFEEIAIELDTTEAAVKMAFSRAAAQLRVALSDAG